MMRILIISDLHIGDKARAKELYPYPGGDHKDQKLVDSFIKVASNYQKEKGPFHYLVIPGDITNRSNLIEYNCGDKFLRKIVAELELDTSKIIFVPGNHDVDWSVLQGIPEEEKIYRKTHKFNTLLDRSHIFSSLATESLTISPYIKKWEFDDVVFFGFNSSWHDDAQLDKHYGLIDSAHIDALKTEFSTIPADKIKIFVVHHHLHQFENPHSEWIDISIMQNAQPLLNLLAENSFNFVFHGHRHLPHFLSTTIENFKPINILCCGSYSCEVPSQIAGHVGNTFHIVEVDSLPNQICKGRIVSMAFDPRLGWVSSKEQHGIEHVHPFGNEIPLHDMLEQCVVLINEYLRSSVFCAYSDLESTISELAYLPLQSKQKLLVDLEQRCSVERATTSNGLIFLKK